MPFIVSSVTGISSESLAASRFASSVFAFKCVFPFRFWYKLLYLQEGKIGAILYALDRYDGRGGKFYGYKGRGGKPHSQNGNDCEQFYSAKRCKYLVEHYAIWLYCCSFAER